jgi:hypothetical protein
MKPEATPGYPAASGRSRANLAFSALLFSFVGWAILERWSIKAGTGPLPQLIISLACAPVLACSLLRFRAACPRHMRSSMRPRGGIKAGGAALAMLFAVGAMFGVAAGSGSVILVVLPAALCCLAPWTRLRVHQQHLALSFLAVAAGSALAPALTRHSPDLMAAVLAAWGLWATASLLCIVLCGGELLRKRSGR